MAVNLAEFFLGIDNFIPLVVAILLFFYYYRLKIVDYLLFGFVFFFSFWSEFFTFLASYDDVLAYYQGTFIMVTLTYICLLLHVHRIENQNLKSIRFAMEISWAFVILFVILSWELMIQPDVSKFFGITVNHGSSLFYPLGAGRYFFNNNLLISTAHSNFIYLFWMYVNGKAVYTYITLELPIDNTTTRRVKWLWIIVFAFSFVWTVSLISFFFVGTFTNYFVLISYVLEIFIALRYSEAVLLTHTQISRAGNILNQSYPELQEKIDIDKYNVNLSEIFNVITSLSYPMAQKLFPNKRETPQALYLLTQSRVIDSFSLSSDFDDNPLIGNLISALLSFSNELLAKGRQSEYYRFQSENFSLIAATINEVIVCYIFSGFAPLAEIRLNTFIIEQQSQAEVWTTLAQNVSFLSSENRQKLQKSIDKVFR